MNALVTAARALLRGSARLLLGAGMVAVPICSPPASAKVLVVGPDQPMKSPSAAASAAQDGDVIQIEPLDGGYFDCAVWHASNLTIEGTGPGVVITDRTCQGKALFVVTGKDVTIRGLTFQRARVPDHNGAGIRAEGQNLRVENSRFINNESGILVASAPDGTVVISGSTFEQNGRCAATCIPGLVVDDLRLLHVEHSVFKASQGGDYVRSRARRTELIDNEFSDGADGVSAYLVELPACGSLTLKGNVLEKGAHAPASPAAVWIACGYGGPPVEDITLSGNRLTNDTGTDLVLLRNWSGTEPVADDNTLGAHTELVSGRGYRWFMTKSVIHAVIYQAQTWEHWGKGLVKSVIKAVI